jgi:FkbM family methyltransferase
MDTNGEVKILSDLLNDNRERCIFDVGANIGEYTKRILKLNPNAIVHCFEPDSSAFAELKFNSNNVFCNRLALGDKTGRKELYVLPKESSFSSFFAKAGCAQSVEIVDVTTLDHYCFSHNIVHVDILKIDTEGSELSILLGSESMLKNKLVDVVQFEYGHALLIARILFVDFVNLFKKYGYILYKIKSNGLELVKYTSWLEGCPYANFVAVRPGSIFFNSIKIV